MILALATLLLLQAASPAPSPMMYIHEGELARLKTDVTAFFQAALARD